MSRVTTPARPGSTPSAAPASPKAPSVEPASTTDKPAVVAWNAPGAHTSPARVSAPRPNALTGTSARPERAPDASSLLRDARAPGILFSEDRNREGYSEDADDPELAAAVEEVIRLLFGVRGVLRVGPGKDDAGAPLVVVSVTSGFAHSALANLPAHVRGFATLVAIPFDALPLKRDR